MYGGITIRPSKLLCLICCLGKNPADPGDKEMEKILEIINKSPDIPVTLRCKTGDIFSFQNVKANLSTSERKKDLEILYKLDLPPGITLTARILILRILNRIKTLENICFMDGKPLCENADKKYYEKSRKLQLSLIAQYCNEFSKSVLAEEAKRENIRIIIPPRTVEDLKKSKQESLKSMYREKNSGIRIRPHLLLCAICQYGGGVKSGQVFDNLPELMELVIKEPGVKITLVEGADWMMCAPCPSWTENNYCVHSLGKCGLSNQLRDMRVLQGAGIDYGTTISAKELFTLILTKIPSTLKICRFDNPSTSMWHSGCGKRKKGSPEYEKGRKKLMKKLNLKEVP